MFGLSVFLFFLNEELQEKHIISRIKANAKMPVDLILLLLNLLFILFLLKNSVV